MHKGFQGDGYRAAPAKCPLFHPGYRHTRRVTKSFWNRNDELRSDRNHRQALHKHLTKTALLVPANPIWGAWGRLESPQAEGRRSEGRARDLPEPGTLAEGTGHRGVAAPAPWHQHTPPAHGKALWGQAYVDRTGTLMLKTGSLILNIHQEE